MPVTVASPPPAKKATPVRPTATDKAAAQLEKDRTEGLMVLVSVAQSGCVITGQLADAGAIAVHGKPVATEIARLAAHDERIARMCDTLIAITPYTALIAAVMPLALQVAVNHGMIKAEAVSSLGVVTAKTLEYEMRTAMMEAELQAKARLEDMEKEARDRLAAGLMESA